METSRRLRSERYMRTKKIRNELRISFHSVYCKSPSRSSLTFCGTCLKEHTQCHRHRSASSNLSRVKHPVETILRMGKIWTEESAFCSSFDWKRLGKFCISLPLFNYKPFRTHWELRFCNSFMFHLMFLTNDRVIIEFIMFPEVDSLGSIRTSRVNETSTPIFTFIFSTFESNPSKNLSKRHL